MFSILMAMIILLLPMVIYTRKISKLLSMAVEGQAEIEAIKKSISEEKPIKSEKLLERLSFPKTMLAGVDFLGARDAQECMNIFIRKYGLESATIASDDGLLILSSKEDGEEDAARFSFVLQEMEKIGPVDHVLIEGSKILIYPVEFDGKNVICAVKFVKSPNREMVDGMREDLKLILEKYLK